MITATEAKNNFGELLEKIQSEPVEISKNGRKVAVVLSVEEYERLGEKAEEKGNDLSWLTELRAQHTPLSDAPMVNEEDYYKQYL